MKLWAVGFGLLGAAFAAYSSLQTSRPTVVVITGDFAGFLEPCGCTLPTTGGIERMATLIRRLQKSNDVSLLVNGALVAGSGRQNELKLETLAFTLRDLSAAAINLSHQDASLGIGAITQIQNQAPGRLISGSIQPTGTLTLPTANQSGPFLIGGISTNPVSLSRPLNTQPVDPEEAIQNLIRQAKDQSLTPVLLVDGSLDEATRLAVKFPILGLIVYRSVDDPPSEPVRVGKTILVTPGEHGKGAVQISFDAGSFTQYQVVKLTPAFSNDPQVSSLYEDYLRQVDKSDLLERLPRSKTRQLAGSKKCQSCHASAYLSWHSSKHATGLSSLEKVKHGRDPDCVVCHVVGLQSFFGFRSRALTPDLANVGCESCHGAGEPHVKSPRTVKMGKVGLKMCASCHTTDQSPNFNALTFWDRIKHR